MMQKSEAMQSDEIVQNNEVVQNDFKVLHEKAVQITQQYLRAESELISILQKIDDCQGYRELGFKSLYDYATQSLKLSEAVAYNQITVARKSREVPRLQEMIQNREISISNARTIAPVLTFENQNTWLEAAATLSKRALEKEIANQVPHAAVQERARPVARDRFEFKLGISEKLYDKLKHVQDLVSSQTQKAATLEETLEALVDLFIEKKDPLEKAKRAESRAKHRGEKRAERRTEKPAEMRTEKRQSKMAASSNASGNVSSNVPSVPAQPIVLERGAAPILPVPGQAPAVDRANVRKMNFSQMNVRQVNLMGQSERDSPANMARPANPRFIPASLEHAVRLRDESQCTHKNQDGTRCSQKRWLDIHHIQPLSQGGKTTFDNLTLICRGHHQVQHFKAI